MSIWLGSFLCDVMTRLRLNKILLEDKDAVSEFFT